MPVKTGYAAKFNWSEVRLELCISVAEPDNSKREVFFMLFLNDY